MTALATPTPTLDGFIAWFYSVTGTTTAQLPEDSPYFGYAYNTSLAIVPLALAGVAGPIYLQAVYCLGASNIFNWAQDVNPKVVYKDDLAYFAWYRKEWQINTFTPGVVASTSDNDDATSLLNQDWMKDMTLMNLQQLKDPYGRQYLAYAQEVGTAWGIS